MHISPELSALRSDPQPMRTAQALLERARDSWLAGLERSGITRELALYGAGKSLSALSALARLIGSEEAARGHVDALVELMTAAMRVGPLGMVPFRHQSTRHHCVMELARSGEAALSLMVYWRRSASRAETACFSSGERHEVCLRGRASGRLVALNQGQGYPAPCAQEPVAIAQGWHAAFDNACQTKLIEQVTQPLVILRLSRDSVGGEPAREYRIDDGGLVHQSAADRADSRREMALAVLGSMGRRDAMPAMHEAALSGPLHVRWEAVRQMLAMDAAFGFTLLCAIAADRNDPLCDPAHQLHASLIAAHPQLLVLPEPQLCPA